MKIAVFSYGLPVPGEKRGGIERVAHALSDGLARRGHRVVVFSHDPKPAGAAYDVHELPWKSFVSTWLGRRVTMGYLGNILAVQPDYREFDVLMAHGDSLLLRFKGKPVVRVMHGSALQEALHASSPGRFVLQCGVYVQELLTAMFESGTVAVSDNARRSNPFIHRVIANGVDTRVFRPMPVEKTPFPSIAFVGALDGRKRGRFLLDVFSRLIRPVHPTAALMFVGSQGPAMPGVTYYTGVDDRQLASLYRRAWVYASPSTYEGFGLPYLEAMACGTAVVAAPNPGSLEVLADGRYGKVASPDEFGAALLQLLGDSDGRLALEVSGLQRATHFSLSAMVDQYETLLSELTCSHARSIASA
ncbi:MAG TPA: glycosyltransferase family 4 protein [Vicinamibacterales bacterium]|nr:glycosyltransferase family 4 protein [Vicinamibacterales bacterium]